jgi:serine/threonine-protein kinase
MSPDVPSETLLLPREATPTGAAGTRGLSTEILSQSARRLRILALLYAFTFFMASFFARLLSEADRARMVANPGYWAPDALSIGLALVVALFTLNKRIPLPVVMNAGLLFLVVSNYGIAIAEYIDPFRLDNHGWMGLSWVAVWTPLYTSVVPTPPRKVLPAMLASVMSVPLMIGYMVLTERTIFRPSSDQFFFWIVFPYLLVAVLGYVGARVVYGLGKEVTRARELGSYQLVERLGQGGMGEVWRAKHRLLARPAAIKLIKLSPGNGGSAAVADTTSLLRRFEREAQVTAQLRSPHTVELWDFGVADDGGFYYVMELLDGLDLETFVARYGPLPSERAIYVIRQMCHSLAEAHSRNLVHRDVKPANIFLCRYGGDHDFVKVLDFGIVKAADSSSLTGTLVTSELVVQGTPAFIAPEQALGGREIDGRADIYATGCVAYWLLTGQRVFAADTVMGLLLHHTQTAPTPPSARSEMPIPAALDQLVLSCLAKNPSDRPQSAKELSERLAGIPGLPVWDEDRAREWWVAHRPEPSGKW